MLTHAAAGAFLNNVYIIKILKCIDLGMALSLLKSPKSIDTRSVSETGSTDS